MECEQDIGFRFAIALQIEIVSHHFKELIRSDAGIKNKGELDTLRIQIVSQALEHGSFSRTHLARKDNKSLAAAHAIDQIGESFLMLWTPVKEVRVRTDVKRVLG